jgi:hypothetical protein
MDEPNPYKSPKAEPTMPNAGMPTPQRTGQLGKDKHPTASLLFGVAAIQFGVALFFWSIHGPEFQWTDWAFSSSFLLFIALGIWARWTPAVPATIGFLLYAAYLGMQAVVSLDLLWSGWIFKLPAAVLLTIALVCGFVCRGEG